MKLLHGAVLYPIMRKKNKLTYKIQPMIKINVKAIVLTIYGLLLLIPCFILATLMLIWHGAKEMSDDIQDKFGELWKE